MEYWKDEAPPKGVSNRNEALKWLTEHLNSNNDNDSSNEGVVYIADDDNTYDLELFVEVQFQLSIPKEVRISDQSIKTSQIFCHSWKLPFRSKLFASLASRRPGGQDRIGTSFAKADDNFNLTFATIPTYLSFVHLLTLRKK